MSPLRQVPVNTRERRQRRRALTQTVAWFIAGVIFVWALEARGAESALEFVGAFVGVYGGLWLVELWIEQPVRERRARKPLRARRAVPPVPGVCRKPSFAEMEAAMDTMLTRGRESLITCDEPVAFIAGVLAEAMHGDQPLGESRDWFVNTVLARIEADRYMARQPPLAADRAKWRNEED